MSDMFLRILHILTQFPRTEKCNKVFSGHGENGMRAS